MHVYDDAEGTDRGYKILGSQRKRVKKKQVETRAMKGNRSNKSGDLEEAVAAKHCRVDRGQQGHTTLASILLVPLDRICLSPHACVQILPTFLSSTFIQHYTKHALYLPST